MKYKVGDRVRIKSLDWYNKNKSKRGNISFPYETKLVFASEMSSFCGQIVTISQKGYIQDIGFYRIKEDRGSYMWTDEMIEGLVEEETKPNIIEEAKTYWDSIKDAWICPEGYIFKDEHGNVINTTKIVLEKKKKEYPKTYEECAVIMGVELWNCLWGEDATEYEEQMEDLMDAFIKLKICRDAYWKIAGDWKPDYDSGVDKFGICTYDGVVQKSNAASHWERHLNKVLEFPTKEMRDAFYENFKKEIEDCKELL